ncbi:CGNR zinc finger domain-containing protein [Actinomycetospora chiangmaiensis]|uniref:CGNR zinc finger domain-containing protein n=1 Tax=Actinomycetospora chiangmaiensis TaxID=402650 RepID=UPI0003A689CB|nr:CGNR zinc finger domain-containing protein [Actinomycetospora chiangmaiensis]
MPTDPAQRFDTGAIWLDLLATVGSAYGPDPVDRMDSVELLRRWLQHEDLSPLATPGPDDVVRAHELRELLRPLGLAAAAGHAPDPAHVEALNAVLAHDTPIQLTADLRAAPPATAADALTRIARQAAEHLCGPAAARLRTCDDHDCAMLYDDVTGRRRWCSAAICGVRHRVRAHRSRLAGGSETPPPHRVRPEQNPGGRAGR